MSPRAIFPWLLPFAVLAVVISGAPHEHALDGEDIMEERYGSTDTDEVQDSLGLNGNEGNGPQNSSFDSEDQGSRNDHFDSEEYGSHTDSSDSEDYGITEEVYADYNDTIYDEEFADQVYREHIEKYCPDHEENADTCDDRISACFAMLIPGHEVSPEEKLKWQNASEQCQKKYGKISKPNDKWDITKCQFEIMGLIVDGDFNKPLIKDLVAKDVASSTTEVIEAVRNSVDTCDVSVGDEDFTYALHICFTRACVSAIEVEPSKTSVKGYDTMQA